MNMSKKVISVILCFFLILTFAACGQTPIVETELETTVPTTTAPTEPPFDIDEYKRDIKNCCSEMKSSTIFLSGMAEYENNLWKSLVQFSGTVTSEKLFSSTCEWLETEGWSKSVVEAQYSKISKSYKEIITTEIDGAESEEIKAVFNEYFDAYIKLYNLVFSPSGTREEFVNNCNDYISIIETSQSKLDILLS